MTSEACAIGFQPTARTVGWAVIRLADSRKLAGGRVHIADGRGRGHATRELVSRVRNIAGDSRAAGRTLKVWGVGRSVGPALLWEGAIRGAHAAGGMTRSRMVCVDGGDPLDVARAAAAR